MAVPSSGTLTMLGLARERKLGNYNSTVTLFYPILMTDLINGGGLNSFPALNVNSPFKPNTSTPHSMSEWYGYDQDYAPPVECGEIVLRFTNRYLLLNKGSGMLFYYMLMGIVKKVYGQQVVHIQTVVLGGSGMENQDSGLIKDFACFNK